MRVVAAILAAAIGSLMLAALFTSDSAPGWLNALFQLAGFLGATLIADRIAPQRARVCAGVEAVFIGSAKANLCYIASPRGGSGMTMTLGGGPGAGIAANAEVGLTYSNAQRVEDLGGGFGYTNVSAGEGVWSGSFETASSDLRFEEPFTFQHTLSWAPGVRGSQLGPFAWNAGGSYTWTT